MEEEYTFRGEVVEAVYESFAGSYWIITDNSGAHPFGYARLANCPQFAEWGTINAEIFENSTVWEVDKADWPHTGPDQIDIEEVSE